MLCISVPMNDETMEHKLKPIFWQDIQNLFVPAGANVNSGIKDFKSTVDLISISEFSMLSGSLA